MPTTTDINESFRDFPGTVLHYEHIRDEDPDGTRPYGLGMVLRGGEHDPFVVWLLIQDPQGTWFAEHGSYCQTVLEAADVFETRAARYSEIRPI